MIAGLIMLFIYAMLLVWAGFMAYKHWDKLSMFSPWHWVCGSSDGAMWFKGIVFAIVFLSGMSYVGYIEASL